MFSIKKEWYEAIQTRKSKRDYSMRSIEAEKINQIVKITEELNSADSSVRVAFVNKNSDEIYKGIIGSYGKVSNAPTYAAFIGNTTDKNIEEKIGYYGESFILEMTGMGLGTCWIGGTYDSRAAEQNHKLKENEKIYAITPIGYANEDVKISERLLKIIVKSDKRKSLEAICEDVKNKELPDWALCSLKAGRLAPSAVNRQPWKFSVGDNSIKVAADKEDKGINYTRRLDCGIAMLHIELGALISGKTGNWTYLEKPFVAEFKII